MEDFKTYPSSTTTDLFTESELNQYEDASTGQRFVNYLVDAILMQFTLAYVTTYLLVEFLLAVSPQTAYDLFGEGTLLASYLVGIINHLVYYTICEKGFRGRTLGKLVTGTRAIRNDGGELTMKDAFLRSLSRIVPFEALSIWISDGLWHDRWTNTRVIKTR